GCARPADAFAPRRAAFITSNRAPPPKEGNRQNVLARFDKISPGARTKNGAKIWAVGSFRMRQHPSKVFWFFLFTKRTVPARATLTARHALGGKSFKNAIVFE
ncbi:hypothetical protein, partial [uncultured Rikenella sp.]|uniref:hypothetical protein n=1 Tax=uncultured Rikenella sp. TaxID=368003 RepID=UPI0026255511